ncbi:MAG TPA: tetratricopeptide repeat-containing protein kinase family protein, partial [Bacteroidia bacterium]|nr:tetratricopeptide repeat-containing protein kinase family protein [Bacteroidia bacterium]
MRFPNLPGYQYEALLGEDSFGWSFVATCQGGERRCVRVFKAQATSDRFLLPIFKAFSAGASPVEGIVSVHDYVLQDPQGLTACATPFYGWKSKETGCWQASSLKSLAGLLNRAQILTVVAELGQCLGSLHAAGWFHGGLRLSSVFLDSGEGGSHMVRVGELGQVFIGGLQCLEAGEMLFYAAPEQLSTGDFNGGRGKGWDVYAFGAVAFQLLTGHLPRLDRLRCYHEENPEWLESATAITFGELSELTEYFLKHLENEATVEWPGPAADAREEALRGIVSSCLQYRVEDRPASMEEVALALRALNDAVPQPVRSREKAAAAPKEREPAAAEEAPIVAARSDFDELSESAPPGRGSILGELRSNPVLRWQVTAICAMTVTLVLTGIALFNYLDVRSKKKESELKLNRELQANINRQAEAYTREQAVKKQNSKLNAELNEVENSKNELLGQAKLTRQLLRETQESGDRFFQLVLQNRDSDVPEFRTGRADALLAGVKHYERLVETYGDAPDFIVSTANALFFLGQIYKEMGEFPKALAAFGEAERRYTALLENEGSAKVDFVKNIAVSKQGLGDLSIRSGEYTVARHYFTEASRFWTEARSREPALAGLSAINIHENSLSIVECEFAMGRLDAALDAAMSVGVRLAEMEKEAPENHRIVGALAKSFSLAGRVMEARGEPDMAREAYQQSGDLYAKAVQLDAAVDAYQLGLGNSLARVGILTGDSAKLEGAAEVLGRIVAANPYESIYLVTLADIYGVLAVAQRDGGKLKNAVALEQKAVSILQPIVESNPAVASDVKFSYARRLAHLAELLGDTGKFDESREPLKQAIAMLEALAADGKAPTEYHRTLARTRGMAGFACIKSGDKGEAKQHLELAKSEWQSYMA